MGRLDGWRDGGLGHQRDWQLRLHDNARKIGMSGEPGAYVDD